MPETLPVMTPSPGPTDSAQVRTQLVTSLELEMSGPTLLATTSSSLILSWRTTGPGCWRCWSSWWPTPNGWRRRW